MLRGILIVGVVGSALTACSGTSGPGAMDSGFDAGIVSVSPVELCERLSMARCGLSARCFAAFDREDPSGCLALEGARCLSEFDLIKASFEANRISVNPSKLATCVARMAGSACPPTFPPAFPLAIAQPFSDCSVLQLFQGTVASGQVCDREPECVEGSVCIKPNGVCRGTCASLPIEGEPCGVGCGAGLRCDDKGTQDENDDRCAPLKASGAVCRASLDCEASLVCRSGHCAARSKVNEPCVFDGDRLSPCEPGLACDVTPFVADAVGLCVVPRKEFEKCQFHWSCAPGLVCADIDWLGFPEQQPGSGLCRKPTGQGSNCPSTQYQRFVGDQCGQALTCSLASSKCEGSARQGDSCTPSIQNCVGVNIFCKPSGSGDVGTCTGPASVGERCAFAIDMKNVVTVPCSSGFCDALSTQTCRAPYKQQGSLCEQDGECLSNRCAVQQDRSLRCAPAC